MTKQSHFVLHAYKLFTFFSMPLISLYLLYRKYKGKEDPERFHERLGEASVARPKGKLIWIHAASVGESLSVLPVIQRLLHEDAALNILITTVTVNSAKMMQERLPERAIHQFVPVDSLEPVKKFLAHWKPDMAIWVESELWPGLIDCAAAVCPVLLINARMSDTSYRYWQMVLAFSKALQRRFTFILAQTRRDMERYQRLGAQQVIYSGNIKYDAPPLPGDKSKIQDLEIAIGERPVWLAASTHADEEVQIAQVHRQLKAHYPGLLTMIVPRHPKRAEEICTAIGKDLVIAKRSANEKVTPETDIYLGDTMGELGIFYRIAPIVFMGGTLIPHGGQNPLEPARLDCAVIVGPHMENFLEIKAAFQEKQAIISVQDNTDLYKTLQSLLADTKKQKLLSKAALRVVKEQSGAIDMVCQYVRKYS